VTRRKRNAHEQLEHSQQVLQALNHKSRRRIMRLALGDDDVVLSPTEAAEKLEIPLSNLSYHFRVLARCKALDLSKEKPAGGSVQHFYRPNREVAKMAMVATVLTATDEDD
jgi:DNA-binding transcriptional ArsR family regulator